MRNKIYCKQDKFQEVSCKLSLLALACMSAFSTKVVAADCDPPSSTCYSETINGSATESTIDIIENKFKNLKLNNQPQTELKLKVDGLLNGEPFKSSTNNKAIVFNVLNATNNKDYKVSIIGDTGGFGFYNDSNVSLIKRVSIDFKNITVENISNLTLNNFRLSAETSLVKDISSVNFIEKKSVFSEEKGSAIDIGTLIGTISKTTFNGHKSTENGGAVYIGAIAEQAKFDDVTFNENQSKISGGGVYFASNFDKEITNSKFNNNQAINDAKDDGEGGALYFAGDFGASGKISNSKFVNNIVGINGGAILFASGFNGTIENSLFKENEVAYSGIDDGEGGAISFMGDIGANAKIANSIFVGNKSSFSGGAVQFEKSASTISNTVFIGNKAKKGGAIYLFNDYENQNNTDDINLHIKAVDAGKTIFYGNEAKNSKDNLTYLAIDANGNNNHGNQNTITFTTESGAHILMFDAFAGFKDVYKTGAGELALGGKQQATNWNINEGTLQLVDVIYKTNEAVVNTLIETDIFSLKPGTKLQGTGSIEAKTIDFHGSATNRVNIDLVKLTNNGFKYNEILNKNINDIRSAVNGIEVNKTEIGGQLTLTVNEQTTFTNTNIDVYLDKMKGSQSLIKIEGKGNVKFDGDNVIRIRGIGFDDHKDLIDNEDINKGRIGDVIDLSAVMGDIENKDKLRVVIAGNDYNSFDGFAQVYGLWGSNPKVNKKNIYGVGVNLSWYSLKGLGEGGGDKQAHGNFNLGANDTFTLNVQLKDREEEHFKNGGKARHDWNGKTLTKSGAGTLILDNTNTYTGDTKIEAGTLIVGSDKTKENVAQINQESGNIIVSGSDVTIGGFGKFGDVVVKNGSNLNISEHNNRTAKVKNLTFEDNSTYNVVFNDVGNDVTANKIEAQDDINIASSAKLNLAFGSGWVENNYFNKNHTILESINGVVIGSFGNVSDNNSYKWLTADVDYTDNKKVTVKLGVKPSDNGGSGNGGSGKIEDIAWLNHNQNQVYQGLKNHNANYDMRLVLAKIEAKYANNEELRNHELAKAYTQIAGEIHTSTTTALMQNSARLRSALYINMPSDFAKSDANLINKYRNNFALGDSKSPQPIWIASYAYSGELKGNDLIAGADNSGKGFLMGANVVTGVDDELSAEVLLGYEQAEIKLDAGRDSKVQTDIYSLGLYGGSQLKSNINTLFGTADLNIRGYGIVSNINLDTKRNLNIADISETAKAKFDGRQTQLSAELAVVYHFSKVGTAIQNTPYVGLTHVRTHLDSARESGSKFNLDLAKNKTNALISQVGMRSKFSLPINMPLSVVTDFSVQHNFNRTKANSTRTFVGQNQSMNIQGLALDSDTANLGLGLNLQTSKDSAIEFMYFGEAGAKQSNATAELNFKTKF